MTDCKITVMNIILDFRNNQMTFLRQTFTKRRVNNIYLYINIQLDKKYNSTMIISDTLLNYTSTVYQQVWHVLNNHTIVLLASNILNEIIKDINFNSIGHLE